MLATRDQRIQNALVSPLSAIGEDDGRKRPIAPSVAMDAIEDRAHHRAFELRLNLVHVGLNSE
jgi:hypothetical protein